MASITFALESGTQILIQNYKSPSTFELLKALIPVIESVEAGEIDGTIGETLETGIFSYPPNGAALLLTNNPERLLIETDPGTASEDLLQAQGGAGEEYCDNVDCPVHGAQVRAEALGTDFGFNDELSDDTLSDALADVILGIACGAVTEDEQENLSLIESELEESFDDVEDMILAFVDQVPNLTEEGFLVGLEELATEITDYADHLADADASRTIIYSIGSGIKMAAAWTTLFSNSPERVAA
jgi:hypothetical protein